MLHCSLEISTANCKAGFLRIKVLLVSGCRNLRQYVIITILNKHLPSLDSFGILVKAGISFGSIQEIGFATKIQSTDHVVIYTQVRRRVIISDVVSTDPAEPGIITHALEQSFCKVGHTFTITIFPA